MERLFKSKDINERRADTIIECVDYFYTTHGSNEAYRFDVIHQFLNISYAAFLTYAMFVTMCLISRIDGYSEMAKVSICLMQKTDNETWKMQERCFKNFLQNVKDLGDGIHESIVIGRCADCCVSWLIKELESHEIPCYQSEGTFVKSNMERLRQKLIDGLNKIY